LDSHCSLGFQPQFATLYRQKALDLALEQYYALDEFSRTRLAYLIEHLHQTTILGYFQANFWKWKTHLTPMPPLVQTRICQAIPKFVNAEAKFHLLKYELLAKVAQFSKYPPQSKISLKNLSFVYQQLWEANEDLCHFESEWYAENSYTTEDLKVMIRAFQYLVRLQLRDSFEAVNQDIRLITNELEAQKWIDYECVYQIDLLDISLNLNLGNKKIIFKPQFDPGFIARPLLGGIFQPFLEDYIIQELLLNQKKNEIGEINQQLKTRELSQIIRQYQPDPITKHHIINLQTALAGKGGQLSIRINNDLLPNARNWNRASLQTVVILLATAMSFFFWLMLLFFQK
jgi:hypothetical protein